MENIKVVKLALNHINIVYKLSKEQFKEESWTLNQLIDSFNSGSTAFYGVFNKDELVCFASILISPDDINLLDIATKETYKKMGYAKKLLAFLISLKSQEQTFSLEVKSKNTPAINLYTSMGFKTLNIRKKYYKDGDDALCMFIEK